jgi:signal transduction histidine kinase
MTVRRVGDSVELLCCDRGPGFLEQDLPVLCERFVRGTGVMGDGTGIGLALVQELACAHGGEVRLRNRAGGGAEVTVTLPATAAPPDVGDQLRTPATVVRVG